MDPRLHLALRSELPEIGRARWALLQFLARENLPARTIYRLEVVLEEVLGNIIRYAFTEPSRSAIALTVMLVAGDVGLTSEDSGTPFDPRDVPEPSRPTDIGDAKVGRWGISLVRKLADGFHHQRRDERNLLEVRIAPDPVH